MRRTVGFLVLLASPWSPPSARAQFVHLGPTDRIAVRIDAEKPFHLEDYGGATSLLQVDVTVPMREGMTAFAGLGISHASSEGRPSSTVLSNVVAGLLFGRDGSYLSFRATLPICTCACRWTRTPRTRSTPSSGSA